MRAPSDVISLHVYKPGYWCWRSNLNGAVLLMSGIQQLIKKRWGWWVIFCGWSHCFEFQSVLRHCSLSDRKRFHHVKYLYHLSQRCSPGRTVSKKPEVELGDPGSPGKWNVCESWEMVLCLEAKTSASASRLRLQSRGWGQTFDLETEPRPKFYLDPDTRKPRPMLWDRCQNFGI